MSPDKKNSVDDIFGKGFEGAELQPSENLWEKVENDLLKKKGERDRRKFFFLRFTLGGCLLLLAGLGGYIYFNGSKPARGNSFSEKLITSKSRSRKDSLSDNISTRSITSNTTAESGKQRVEASTKVDASLSFKAYTSASIPKEENHVTPAGVRDVKRKDNEAPVTFETPPESIAGSLQMEVNKTIATTTDTGKKQDLIPGLAFKEKVQEPLIRQDTAASILPALVLKTDTLKIDTLNIDTTSASSVGGKKALITGSSANDEHMNNPGKWWIGVQFSPDYARLNLKDNGSNSMSKEIVSVYTTYSQPQFSYSTGLDAGYRFSEKWTLRAGLHYFYRVENIPQLVELMDTAASSNYSMENTMPVSYRGNVMIVTPNTFSPPASSSKMMMQRTNTMETRYKQQSLELPVLIEWNRSFGKFGLNAAAGFAANYFLKQTTAIITRSSGEQIMSNDKGGDFKTMALSGVFCLGANYKLNDFFVLSAEPTFRYTITSTLKSNSIQSMPYSIGVVCAIRYYFKN